MKQTIAEKIKQRRRQMLVHSYIYYELDTNIVSDSTWSRWAVELAKLQEQYPDIASEVEFAEEFKDWDGSSGAFLIFPDFVSTVAKKLLELEQKKKPVVIDTPAKKTTKVVASRKLF